MDVDGVDVNSGEPLDALITEHLGEALRCAALGTWGWDLDTNRVVWSLSPRAKHDVRPNADTGSLDRFLAVALPEDQPSLAHALDAGRSTGSEIHHTFRNVRLDGTVGKVTLDAAPIRNSHEVVAFVGVTRDDTAQMLVLEHSTERFDIRDRVARALEISLLPPTLPQLPGFSADADFRSTEGTSTGDFYDLFPLGGKDWGLTIGDVEGHGTDAAAVTTAVRYTLRAAAQVRKNPLKVMAAGNEAHLAAVHDGRFTTAHYVRFTPSVLGFQARIATAGHPAMFIRRANGAVEDFAGTGPMLGLMQPARFKEARTVLDLGDMLVACTDGVLEARRDGVLFGRDGVEAFLRERQGPVDGCAAALHDAATEFCGGPVGDDMATVVLRVDDDTGAN